MINNNKIKLKEKNQPKPKNKSVSFATSKQKKLLYEILKNQKLNEIKNKTRRVSQIMDKIGETFNTKKRNSKIYQSDLITQNLTKINFRRSLLIQKQLKVLDKLNNEFDREYINDKFDFNYDNRNNYHYYSDSEDEYDKYMVNQNDENLQFNSEQRRIFRLLFRKNENNENRPFSDYKKNKKLNDLKSNIEYICGIKLDEDNIENKNEMTKDELEKNTHFFIPKRNPRFIRDKNKTENFTPTMQYDKTKIFYEKKYVNSIYNNDKSKKFINHTLQNYFTKKSLHKKKLFLKKSEISPIKKKKRKPNTSKEENVKKEKEEEKEKEQFPYLQDEELKENKFKTLTITKTFKKIGLKNFSHNNRNNSKRHIKYLKTENNTTGRKKMFEILTNLLKETYLLNNDLKIGIKIISSHLNDYKQKPKKKDTETDLDIEKIRKDLKLNKINPIIRESDIIIKNEKKMEKRIRKEDAQILRQIVNTILQEDRLANKNTVYNSDSLGSRLKKIIDRKMKTRNVLEPDEPGEEKKQMIKLFKNDAPDFFNMTHLSNLIKRYKTMKIK